MNFILIHYGEIALKGGNRKYFEDQLIQSIKTQLAAFAPESFESIKKISGSILVKLKTSVETQHAASLQDALGHTFGIVNFSFCENVEQDLEIIKEKCLQNIKTHGHFDSFRITVQRSNKKFPKTSEQLEKEIGAYIFNYYKGEKKVSLKNADCDCQVIIVNDLALITLKKQKGLGGLPVGTAGKAMVLISGGFDSPVAAWHILKRGAQLRYVHFHSMPYTSKASIEKIKEIIKTLNKFGSSTKTFLIPFADIQKQIMINCPEKLRVIIYRRMMIRIAEALAKKQKCQALVTGDSLGQVASQTMENISAVNQAATLPIYRPLIGMDKEEIMQRAKEIGTYEISKLPHDDCCTRLMPKNPETKAKIKEVIAAEENLNIEEMINEVLKKITVL